MCEVMAATFSELFVFSNVFYFNKNQDIILNSSLTHMNLVFIQ